MEFQKQNVLSEQEKQNLKENKKRDHKFRDQCDVCNNFDYCSGYNGKVLCKSCIEKEVSESNIIIKGQMSIFDLLWGDDLWNFQEKIIHL